LRPDAGAEQGLGSVDVPHADDDLRVHDDELDRGRAFRAGGFEVLHGEAAFQRFRAEVFQQGVRHRIGLHQPQHQSKAPRVVETQLLAISQRDTDVVMFFPILRRINHPQAAGHAEMNEQRRAVIDFK